MKEQKLRRRRSVRFSVLMTLGLVVVWIMLVGEITVGAAVFGLIVAVAVQLLFPIPVIPQMGRMRILRLIWMILVTLWGLATASFVVAAQVLAFRRRTRNSVVNVDLRSKDVFSSTLTAVLVTLVPGSVVLEVYGGRLLVHVFDTQDEASLEHWIEGVHKQEALVLRAFGTPEEVAAIRQESRQRRTGKEETA
ncbi:Na+/H+ antiporter subunit E [Agrococcus casei]|uniref:Na+/H+ antiporter subunit E n=1 Tax=Agrococcus casei TaxID=343512 RepID=UPI003F8EC022